MIKEKTVEYIYLDDENVPMYSSKNVPLKYEDQTPCIKVETDSKQDMELLLDLLFGPNT